MKSLIQTCRYCAHCQLEKLREVKRPGLLNRRKMILHHDNAESHVALNVQNKLREFGWEILLHPPCSLETVASDYHLFRVKYYESDAKIKTAVNSSFASKTQDF
ncbi:Histone-lysine N-methyltransferase SETMAR [Habropoda laboriosa]|uniref:Histone-lysine N-methyltransferase SETMAR n=1 Tax=Habropoda laboriosa TaxID=597456 RepID=A0A0L7R162_9HYME|nr:Histone-lysine N-methyltransferase SETMAR [Habropoda laboriosa]